MTDGRVPPGHRYVGRHGDQQLPHHATLNYLKPNKKVILKCYQYDLKAIVCMTIDCQSIVYILRYMYTKNYYFKRLNLFIIFLKLVMDNS